MILKIDKAGTLLKGIDGTYTGKSYHSFTGNSQAEGIIALSKQLNLDQISRTDPVIGWNGDFIARGESMDQKQTGRSQMA